MRNKMKKEYVSVRFSAPKNKGNIIYV